MAEVYGLHERLLVVHIPHNSSLAGKTLAESRLGDAFGLSVVGIVRQDNTELAPSPNAQLMAGDTLLVEGRQEDLLALHGLQNLEVDSGAQINLPDLESEQIGLIEATLSPYTTLAGKTLRQLNFREKYGLNVVAIWREGKAYHDDLRDTALRFGDVLLLYGRREKANVLGSEPDFLVLSDVAQETATPQQGPYRLADHGRCSVLCDRGVVAHLHCCGYWGYAGGVDQLLDHG